MPRRHSVLRSLSRPRRKGPPKSAHRRPPKPESWNAPRGWCRFCGTIIIEKGKQNKRKNWCSRNCILEWKCMNDPRTMRKFVLLREKYTCQECHEQHPNARMFEIDHIKPLYESMGDLSYFSPDNAQLLCKPCHKKKTKVDLERWRTYFKPEVKNDDQDNRNDGIPHYQGNPGGNPVPFVWREPVDPPAGDREEPPLQGNLRPGWEDEDNC